MIAGVLGGNANGAVIGADRQLNSFQRNNPPLFKGTHDPDGAQKWLKEIERIFRVIDCAENLKVRYGTHMLSEEADDWWVTTKTELDSDGIAITWAIFKREFLRKYFPEDVRGRKEIEFLELTQGSMTVPEYASKFVELAKYYTPTPTMQLENSLSVSSLRMVFVMRSNRASGIKGFADLLI